MMRPSGLSHREQGWGEVVVPSLSRKDSCEEEYGKTFMLQRAPSTCQIPVHISFFLNKNTIFT